MMTNLGVWKQAKTQPVQYGLHILVDKDPGAPDIVDVVAIHGLNGHYERTWTSQNQDGIPVNWLRDLLPKDREMNNLRIMSFAYNSLVQFSKSTADIFYFADQLLEQLFVRHPSLVECRRPLIFICHSLGGIVFKQIANKAHSNEKYTKTISKCIHGVLFFGTPHRGSDIAKWGTIVGNILRAGSFKTSTNLNLVKDLQRKSKALETISSLFIDRGKDLKIVSFYETQTMDYLNCLVVDKDSATLDWPQETRIPLNANHRSMCWFTTAGDQDYKTVKSYIARMASQAKELDPADTYLSPQSIKMKLHSSDYETHKDRNPRATQGTCKWIFQQQNYRSWAHEQASSLLWISADPGCGKSVLASFLVDHHKTVLSNRGNVCHFFFKADNEEQRSAVHAVSAILHQLYSYQPELIECAQQILHTRGYNASQLPTLWKIFTESIESPNAQQTVCIIDGVDECEELTRISLVNLISKYFAESDESIDKRQRLKILVTSRPDNFIKSAFDKSTGSNLSEPSLFHSRMRMIRLRGEDEVDSISADVELVIRHTMQDFVGQGLPPDLLKEIEDQLIARADRTFLWIALMLELMKEKAVEGASQRELEVILQSHGVYGIYSALLDSKANHAQARKLLNLVLVALEPLTVEELSIALAIQPDHHSFEKSNRPRRPGLKIFSQTERDIFYPAENHLKSLCGHFIRIIRGKVYLVHQTAREFLIDEASRELSDAPYRHETEEDELFWSIDMSDIERIDRDDGIVKLPTENPHTIDRLVTKSPWQHSFSLLEAHALLLEICVTYLYLLGKKSAASQLGQPSVRMSSFLRYASKSWLAHFHVVRDRIPTESLSYYHGLCHPRFPGFKARTEFHENIPFELTLLMSEDEKQDCLVNFFNLEPGDTGYRETLVETDGMASFDFSYLSSNPAASENFHFPVQPDVAGYVSLDLDETRKLFSSNKA